MNPVAGSKNYSTGLPGTGKKEVDVLLLGELRPPNGVIHEVSARRSNEATEFGFDAPPNILLPELGEDMVLLNLGAETLKPSNACWVTNNINSNNFEVI